MMTSCKEIIRLSSKSLDSKLNWREKFSLTFHNMMCPFCRGYTKEMKELMKLVRNKRLHADDVHKTLSEEKKEQLKKKVSEQIANS